MISGAALSCPKCRRELPAVELDAGACSCGGCGSAYVFVGFPARRATRSVVRARNVAEGEEASCFFHAENQAEAVCDGCGRYLCAVCSIPMGGRTLCPSCIAAQKDTGEQVIKSRMLYDSLALTLAVLPMIIWPFTVVTGPIALGMVIYGWRKPGSLVRGRRWRMIVAAIIAVVQISVWLFILGYAIFSTD